ncbi:hypothetical protein BJ944DRAFT_176819 [Cunninghamella echinulata]|nr:hypothetical protein BJ944DRAFT_176819 [Cunninghamella echinulata]
MVSSSTEIVINGLELSVYGLKEYQQLSKDNSLPVCVIFLLHGRLQKKRHMETIAQALCELNETKQPKQKQRHLLAISFDHLNHGSRLLVKERNYGWKESGQENPTHALNMWSTVRAGAHTVSELIDVLEFYLFGPSCHPVEKWGTLGFSLGGHSTFLTANDPRISVHIPIVGSADYIALMRARLIQGQFPESYLPEGFSTTVQAISEQLPEKIKNKKILMISGGKDQLVPGRFNDGLVRYLKQQNIKEYHDWARIIVQNVGHAWYPEMIQLSAQWCQQWLLSIHPNPSFVLSLPDTCKL